MLADLEMDDKGVFGGVKKSLLHHMGKDSRGSAYGHPSWL
jgi:hypothetical protein